ncbi:MAG: FAD binding domain-containing protein [Anaerolineales bacterium]|nr:FAD binding domain-containing protein [Anaerolineales bacterium]
MITAYHRPRTLKEALSLLARPNTYPLGGGTLLNRPSLEQFAVVDLQALGLNKIHKNGNNLEIGATATLQALLDSQHIPPALQETIRLETTYNLRQVATVAGTLVSADGRSPFVTAMLALDASCTVFSNQYSVIILGDLLPYRTETLHGKLITKIEISLNVNLSYESVARTPADRPIVCAALAQWPAGRTRLVIGGWGKSPTLALDGNEASGVEAAARNAAQDAADEWGSAEYRSEVAGVLAKRCQDRLNENKTSYLIR